MKDKHGKEKRVWRFYIALQDSCIYSELEEKIRVDWSKDDAKIQGFINPGWESDATQLLEVHKDLCCLRKLRSLPRKDILFWVNMEELVLKIEMW